MALFLAVGGHREALALVTDMVEREHHLLWSLLRHADSVAALGFGGGIGDGEAPAREFHDDVGHRLAIEVSDVSRDLHLGGYGKGEYQEEYESERLSHTFYFISNG